MKTLLFHVNVHQRPSIAGEVLNWAEKTMCHPVVVSQPLSLVTPAIVQGAPELSSHVGRDRGHAWAQSLGLL